MKVPVEKMGMIPPNSGWGWIPDKAGQANARLDRHIATIKQRIIDRATKVNDRLTGHISKSDALVTARQTRLADAHAQIDTMVERAGNRAAKYNNIRKQAAAAQGALPGLRNDLAEQERIAAHMHQHGKIIATPASLKRTPTQRQLIENAAKPQVEVQDNITRLRKQIDKAEKAAAMHEPAVNKLNIALSRRKALEDNRGALVAKHQEAYDKAVQINNTLKGKLGATAIEKAQAVGSARHAAKLERDFRVLEALKARRAAPYFDKVMHAPESLAPEHVAPWVKKEIGSQLKGVRDPKKALIENGHGYLVHTGVRKAVMTEADNTLKTIHAIHVQPTRVWKWAVLASAPRYFVNNLLGQSIMLGMAHNPVAVSRGILQAIHDVHGAKAAEKASRQMGDHLNAEMVRLGGTVYHKWYAGPHASPFGELEKAGAKSIKTGVAHGLYGAVDKVAYTGHRMVGVNIALSELPQVRKLMQQFREQGMGRHEAFAKAADQASQNPAVRSYVEKRSSDWAGQYHHSNSLENVLRHIVPFYSWDRHAMRFAKEQVLARPAQSAALEQLGKYGNTSDQKILGNLPDFLQGAVPIQGHHGGILGAILGHAVPGRKKIVLSSGVNPLGSAADSVHALGALVGAKGAAEAIGSQLNPIIGGAITGVTGQRLATGARVHHQGGLVGSAIAESFGQAPPIKLLDTVIHGNPSLQTKSGNPKLYTHDTHSQVASLFGVPVRDINVKAATKLYNAQEGITKTKRRRKSAGLFGA